MSFRVLFAGGGTGGHVFPLLAVAEAMRSLRSDVEAVFVGTARGMEATLLPSRGERLELLDVIPIKGGGLRGAIKGIAKAAGVLPASRELVRRIAPDVVLSIGGYAAGPVSLAARTLGVPVALLEPNSVLGLANHLMTPLVRRAYVVFPEVERRFRPSIVRRFGLPLRPGFVASEYAPVDGRAQIVVLGGSQGAEALNERLPRAIAAVRDVVPHVRVLHQAGKGRDEAVRARYAELGLSDVAEVLAFVSDVPAVLASADLVVARAGAGTVCEICAVGRPALFVPYPFAADDHQRRNAEALAAAGVSLAVVQPEATSDRLAREIAELFRSPKRRMAMAEAARLRGVPDAAEKIALDLFALAGEAAETSVTSSSMAVC
jgi:UDP-N-acetylglucosamine--N-acetylmuramyl-(pentapeptide) pyrophosphoryl-undecaprenol N-acetylglucosamine transferase